MRHLGKPIETRGERIKRLTAFWLACSYVVETEKFDMRVFTLSRNGVPFPANAEEQMRSTRFARKMRGKLLFMATLAELEKDDMKRFMQRVSYREAYAHMDQAVEGVLDKARAYLKEEKDLLGGRLYDRLFAICQDKRIGHDEKMVIVLSHLFCNGVFFNKEHYSLESRTPKHLMESASVIALWRTSCGDSREVEQNSLCLLALIAEIKSYKPKEDMKRSRKYYIRAEGILSKLPQYVAALAMIEGGDLDAGQGS